MFNQNLKIVFDFETLSMKYFILVAVDNCAKYIQQKQNFRYVFGHNEHQKTAANELWIASLTTLRHKANFTLKYRKFFAL